MSKMGANALFNERVQTRILQAIGRCTRSLNDYSAVVVTGADLPDYLTDRRRRRYLHPELQAELSFGADQSSGVSLGELVDNFKIFLKNDSEWETVNDQIVAERNNAQQEQFPGLDELASVVSSEVRYQEYLWQGDFESAMEQAGTVLAGLTSSELQGYRALWHYLAGSAAWQGAIKASSETLKSKARSHYANAKSAAKFVNWLIALAGYQQEQRDSDDDTAALLGQLERVEEILLSLGTAHEAAYARREKEILDGLASNESKKFELAQKQLGELLGFVAGKEESDGSPDPWWIAGKRCIVFEDHSNANPASSLDATKARQTAGHPNWIRSNVGPPGDTQIISVLVSPVNAAHPGAVPHLNDFSLWPLQEFRDWAQRALETMRELRRKFLEPGDLEWRAIASKAFTERRLDAAQIYKWMEGRPASAYLKEAK